MPSHPSTLLELTGIEFSPYSVRGLKMQIQPISGQFARDINGTLHNIGGSQFRKYRAVISCTDHFPIELLETFVGLDVFVKCIPYVLTADDSKDPVTLHMMVTDWNTDRDEAGAISNWSLQLEEI